MEYPIYPIYPTVFDNTYARGRDPRQPLTQRTDDNGVPDPDPYTRVFIQRMD